MNTPALDSLTRARTPFGRSLPLVLGTVAVVALASCAAPAADSTAESQGDAVTLIVHDSFATEGFEAAASAAIGYDVSVITSGDSGQLASQLALTPGEPVADAFYGVDNLYVSRVVDAGAVTPHIPADLPDGAESFTYDDAGSVTAIDYGSSCINVDSVWFDEQSLALPESFDDLAAPEYADLTTVIDPTTSSTGGTWLLGTIAEFGEDGFAGYWERLIANGATIAEGWTAAYEGQFTQGGGEGTRPIVLSYSTSPAWTLTDDGGASTTQSVLSTCAQHVEYAGVLAGTANEDGAKALIDYLVSRDFQDGIAESMYMYPVDSGAYVPEEWQTFAPIPAGGGLSIPAAEVSANRDGWLKTWADAVGY